MLYGYTLRDGIVRPWGDEPFQHFVDIELDSHRRIERIRTVDAQTLQVLNELTALRGTEIPTDANGHDIWVPYYPELALDAGL